MVCGFNWGGNDAGIIACGFGRGLTVEPRSLKDEEVLEGVRAKGKEGGESEAAVRRGEGG